MKTLPAILGVALLAWAGSVAASGNLIRNPRFESDGKRPGIPDEWSTAGDPRSVTQDAHARPRRGPRRPPLCQAGLHPLPRRRGIRPRHACQLGVPVGAAETIGSRSGPAAKTSPPKMISVADEGYDDLDVVRAARHLPHRRRVEAL